MGYENLIVVATMVFILYMLVFLLNMADLWSGVRKAIQRGEARTSYGFRRTVEKLAKYYNLLLALTCIDGMQLLGVWYLDTKWEYSIPLLPIVTFIGALGIGFIEVKSIYEKAEEKEYKKVIGLASQILTHKDNATELSKVILDYFESNKNTKPNGSEP